MVETNVHLIETTIRESTAFGAGGALFRASPVLIEDSFFDENVASVYGGGLAVEGNGVGAPLPVTLIRVHVRGNQATRSGLSGMSEPSPEGRPGAAPGQPAGGVVVECPRPVAQGGAGGGVAGFEDAPHVE